MMLNATKTLIHKMKPIGLLWLLCSMFAPTTIYAADLDADAAVNLLFGLTITEDREIDFGSLSGISAADCTMALGGGLSGSATGCAGTQTSGLFTVGGVRFFQVTVSVLPGSSDGITFTPTFGPSTTLSGFLPQTTGILGAVTLQVVGQLSWSSTLLQGPKVIPYTFVADYN